MQNEHCHCHTAAARYRCRHHDPGTGDCDRPAPDVPAIVKDDAERMNDMATMWIEGMKQDGLSYAQMLQVFALARQKYEALQIAKDECVHEKTFYCYITGGLRCRKCRKCL